MCLRACSLGSGYRLHIRGAQNRTSRSYCKLFDRYEANWNEGIPDEQYKKLELRAYNSILLVPTFEEMLRYVVVEIITPVRTTSTYNNSERYCSLEAFQALTSNTEMIISTTTSNQFPDHFLVHAKNLKPGCLACEILQP